MSFASISYAGFWFNCAKINSRIRDISPCDAYLSFSCIYFLLSLLKLNEYWPLLSGPGSAVSLNVKKTELIIFPFGGLPFGLQAVPLKPASLCLMLLLSQIKFSTVQIRNETSVFKNSILHALLSCCVQTSSFHKSVWQDFVGIVLLGFSSFDHACHTRQKAEGKLLVSLEYMSMKLMFCFPRFAQRVLAGWWHFHLYFSNRKKRKRAKPTW